MVQKDLIYLDISFEQASKFIVSAGTSDPNSFTNSLSIISAYQKALIKNYTY